MIQFLNDNAALVAIVAGGVFLWFRYGRGRVAPRNSAAPAAAPAPAEPQIVYREAPVQRMKLLDLHEEFVDETEREIKREGIKRQLQQGSMDRWALERIAEVYAPPAPPSAPKS